MIILHFHYPIVLYKTNLKQCLCKFLGVRRVLWDLCK